MYTMGRKLSIDRPTVTYLNAGGKIGDTLKAVGVMYSFVSSSLRLTGCQGGHLRQVCVSRCERIVF